ncbi:homocysteine S-methyltransferase family protein [Acinetobacter nosocomialis]|uniref:homocysteine S-methyltransferase family protein n=1 Tax=Acinetobacter nosocomialis TaxID=106654 RepID=UPI000DE64622|nr:homocysteine S-methyltransferase family protein [Acinetobacter nosocomialis]SSR40408.1 homocysteine S-methyltransferase family protein [Acinetobacter baumannii]MBR7690851.1 homocysteine S-methyltransferase family protein [Acinetobacter nosocomialis]MBR7728923.1 homocysteine S-methyltransferase family protein [Acinetobacter nosocomialis]MBS0034527.1 homocysteine S-methyltransferase family protein [Acinetobacter nosocomialis]MDQ8802719.1 homocysteine S-methyltransferase family protein [Acinet
MKILDGGLGRELARRGAPFRQPEWSALALIEAPETVKEVHLDFINAGAEVITTNNYAVVPFHIGQERFETDGVRLIKIAIEQAKNAVKESGKNVKIAGCLPPLFGSYRADLFQPEQAKNLAEPIINTLAPEVDFWLAETQSCLKEVETVHALLPQDDKDYWVSFTLQDEIKQEQALLRSGENMQQVADFIKQSNAKAVLFNCCQPEVILQAINEIKGLIPESVQIGAYANAFPPQDESATANDGLDEIRKDLDAPAYLAFAKQWQQAGASLVGGCCGIGPEHIAELSQFFKE